MRGNKQKEDGKCAQGFKQTQAVTLGSSQSSQSMGKPAEFQVGP